MRRMLLPRRRVLERSEFSLCPIAELLEPPAYLATFGCGNGLSSVGYAVLYSGEVLQTGDCLLIVGRLQPHH